MQVKRLTAALVLASIAGLANADELSVQVHGLSHHFTPGEWNERNAGLGIRYAFDRDVALQGGLFRNSISRTSVYALADWTPFHVGAVSAGAFAGVATGYMWRPVAGLTPVTGAVVRADFGRFSVAVRFTPPHPKASAVAALEFGWGY